MILAVVILIVGLQPPRSGSSIWPCLSLRFGVQEKLYAYVSIGGHHQNTSLNTTDARSPSWSDTLTFEHPSLNHTDLSVAVYAKHTLLPDTLVGSAGNTILRLYILGNGSRCNCLCCNALFAAEYPLNRISGGEQLRVPLVDKSGDRSGEFLASVNTGGYGSE